MDFQREEINYLIVVEARVIYTSLFIRCSVQLILLEFLFSFVKIFSFLKQDRGRCFHNNLLNKIFEEPWWDVMLGRYVRIALVPSKFFCSHKYLFLWLSSINRGVMWRDNSPKSEIYPFIYPTHPHVDVGCSGRLLWTFWLKRVVFFF